MKKAKIIGAGISGITLANVLANNGWKVDLYEKKQFVGGFCFDKKLNGVLIHKFGPHIFHTDKEHIYKFLKKFTAFNGYVNKVLVKTKNKTFPLPINFNSIKIISGKNANKVIATLKNTFPNFKTITLFDGQRIKKREVKETIKWIAHNVYFNYSQKMWGVNFSQIDRKTINRVKIFLSYLHNYFPDDKYQGLPSKGYTKMFLRMLKHPNIRLHLNYDALKHIKWAKNIIWDSKKIDNCKVIYSGALDQALNFKYGILPYRSLDIRFKTVAKTFFQETGVINYPSDPKMTRITEYKYLTKQKINGKTVISKEYPGQFVPNSKKFNIPFYPIIDKKNIAIYNRYLSFFKKYKNFYPLGRLAQYKYYDMDDATEEALKLAKRLLNA